MSHTYTTAEAAIVAAALAVAVEQQIAAGLIPMPGEPKRFVAFGEMSELHNLVQDAAPSAQQAAGSIDTPEFLGRAIAAVSEMTCTGETGEWDSFIAHIHAWAAATPAQPIATELSESTAALVEQLREYAANPGYSHGDCADTMKRAADCLGQLAYWVELYQGRYAALADRAAAPSEQTNEWDIVLTDADIDTIWQTMPGGPAGWLKSFGYQQFAREIEDEVLSRRAAAPVSTTNRAEFIKHVLLSVAEIPDRDSPEDQPAMMLVTGEELKGILLSAFEHEDEAAPVSGPTDAEPDAPGEWRRLALQFDGHRMAALSHLRLMTEDPAAHRAVAAEFLRAPPLSGEAVLAERIAALAAPVSGQGASELPLTIGDAFKAVGGWMNGGELGYPSFGSMDALRVYTQKMLRAALASVAPTATSGIGGDTQFMQMLKEFRGCAADTVDSRKREIVAYIDSRPRSSEVSGQGASIRHDAQFNALVFTYMTSGGVGEEGKRSYDALCGHIDSRHVCYGYGFRDYPSAVQYDRAIVRAVYRALASTTPQKADDE